VPKYYCRPLMVQRATEQQVARVVTRLELIRRRPNERHELRNVSATALPSTGALKSMRVTGFVKQPDKTLKVDCVIDYTTDESNIELKKIATALSHGSHIIERYVYP
jgi:hypothetical protein